jgi:hypothetical protein
MWLLTTYLDCNIMLLLLLLNMMKSYFFLDKGWNKLLMPIIVEEVEDLQS